MTATGKTDPSGKMIPGQNDDLIFTASMCNGMIDLFYNKTLPINREAFK